MRLKTVVLPDPFGPSRPRISPSCTVNETSSTARRPPKVLVRFRTSSSGCWLTATPGRRGVQKGHGAQILGPDQLLLPGLPLHKDGRNDPGSIGSEPDATDDRLQICRGDGVADGQRVKGPAPLDCVGHDLYAGVSGTNDHVGGAAKALFVLGVELRHSRKLNGVVPPGGEQHI